jgi:hypothetical protein
VSSRSLPPLVAAVEAVLQTKVLSLRYLPSPTAAAAAQDDRIPKPLADDVQPGT